ncbi:GIY-YIG nuclease family protein [Halorubrum pallidum]
MSGGSDGERADPDDGGTYTLLVDLSSPATIEVGALGEHRLPAGTYAYTGSALGAGGFARVDRHRRTARGDHDVRHWHVDYLLTRDDARIDRVVRSVGVDAECAVAAQLPPGPVGGFGSSDCDCPDHLAALGDGSEAETDPAALVRDAHASVTPGLGGRVDVVAGSEPEE